MKLVRIVLILLATSTLKKKEACRSTKQPKINNQRGTNPDSILLHNIQEISVETPVVATPVDVVQGPVEQHQHHQNHKSKKEYMSPPLEQDEPPQIVMDDDDILEMERVWLKDHVPLMREPVEEEEDSSDKENSKNRIETLRDKVNGFLEPDGECEVRMNFQTYMADRGMDFPMTNSWNKFFAQTTNCHMHQENSDVVEQLLKDMAGNEIVNVEKFQGAGTQMKLLLTFEDGKKAIFKPMRFDENYEADPNQYFFCHLERPNAEIAAFHIDKLLGFRRAVPTTGRKLSISKHLIPKSFTDSGVIYFYSPKNNLCFFVKCGQYCDTAHAICGDKDTIQGSVQAWIPDEFRIGAVASPYVRAKVPDVLAEWQNEEEINFCDKYLKSGRISLHQRDLSDLVDLSILDFIMGNKDRYEYYVITLLPFADWSFKIPLDNGRSFDDLNDDPQILAPLTQCCIVRLSTVKTLLKFYDGPSLSEKLKESLTDEVFPILSEKYFSAIDRRVRKILEAVADCILDKVKDPKKVFMNIFKPSKRSMHRAMKMANSNIMTEIQQPQKRNGIPDMKHWQRGYKNEPHEKPYVPKAADQNLVTALKKWKVEEFVDPQPECPDEMSLTKYLEINEKMLSKDIVNDAKDEDRNPEKFSAHITTCGLYTDESNGQMDEVVEERLKYLSDTKVKKMQPVLTFSGDHTRMKFLLTFDEDWEAIFTPMRFDRNYETDPNHFYFDDFERHNAVIAAFHLDRLLGFRRVLPAVERELDINELEKPVSGPLVVFFHSPNSVMYDTEEHAICGDPDNKIKGSVQVRMSRFVMEHIVHEETSPYKKTFEKKHGYKLISKQTDDMFCSELKKEEHNNGRRLLDLVDLYIFDFLTGNKDRDVYHIIKFPKGGAELEPYIFVDNNGKAFGDPRSDDLRTIAPLTQCCVVRPSTVQRLLKFYDHSGEGSLAQKLDETTHHVLAQKYLVAIDRRVEIVLREVLKCIEHKKGVGKVLINRFKYNPEALATVKKRLMDKQTQAD